MYVAVVGSIQYGSTQTDQCRSFSDYHAPEIASIILLLKEEVLGINVNQGWKLLGKTVASDVETGIWFSTFVQYSHLVSAETIESEMNTWEVGHKNLTGYGLYQLNHGHI